MAAVNFRGLQLEKKYAPGGEIPFLNIYISVTASQRDSVKQLSDIANLGSLDKQINALRVFRPSNMGLWLPIGIVIIEIVAGFVLWLQLGWSLL